MKMKFGAIVVAGSGKIGGHVASRNRAGAYLRTKVTPVNPQTSFQNTVRSRLTSFSQAWRDLTAAQRAAWNAAVASFAKTDIFGDLKNPTGFNLYQRLNNNLSAVGEAAISSPPQPSEVSTVTIASLVASMTGPALTLNLSANVPTGSKVKIFATPPVSAGVSFVKSEYRLIQIGEEEETQPIALYSAWNNRFGTFALGQKIFVKIVFVNIATGQESSPQSASAIVGA